MSYRKNMNITDLITQAIDHFLDRKLYNDCQNLAEEQHYREDEVWDFMISNYDTELDQLGYDGESDDKVEELYQHFKSVYEDECQTLYEEYVQRAIQSEIDREDWESTKASLRPIKHQSGIIGI